MRGGNWKTLPSVGSVEARVIHVRKGKKRQQSIPRVGLRMDKLMVHNISSIVFRQAVSDLGYALVALKSFISQSWLGLVPCVLGKIFPSGKQRIPVALQGPWKSPAQTHQGCINWQSYSYGATGSKDNCEPEHPIHL